MRPLLALSLLALFPIFHLFEVFNQAAVSTIKHDKIYGFPLFYPEAKVAFQSIFLKSLEEFKERERRRPSDKKFLAQPSGKELLSSLETLVEKSFMPDSFSSRVSRVTFLGRGKGNPYSLIYATKPNLEVGEVRALLELFKSSAPLPWNTKQWGYSLCDEINIVGFLINPKIASQSSTCKSSRRLNKSSGFNLLLGKSSSLASIFEGSCIANSSLLNIAKLVQSPTNNASNGFDTGAYQVEIEKMQFIRAKLIELMRNGESLVWIRPLNTPWLYYPASMKSESMWME